MTLYNYHRSSASMRVRIALSLKGLAYDYISVDLFRGVQFGAEYRGQNPQSLIPTLVDGEVRIAQSMAILEYLEERWPQPALLPADSAGRARVRSLCQYVVSEMQPINTLRVGRYFEEELRFTPEQIRAWRVHWVELGFDSIEAALSAGGAGLYCHGDTVTLADCVLFPQAWFLGANLQMPLDRWPTIAGIVARCSAHPAFAGALPEHQPDAPG